MPTKTRVLEAGKGSFVRAVAAKARDIGLWTLLGSVAVKADTRRLCQSQFPDCPDGGGGGVV